MKDSYLELDFIVTHRVGAHARYADGNHLSLVNLGHIALFKKYRLTISFDKELEESDKAQVICLMHKLISSSRDSDDSSINFYRSNEARQSEKTFNKSTKGIYYVRIFSKDNFGFTEGQPT